jgi:hypothetical protein
MNKRGLYISTPIKLILVVIVMAFLIFGLISGNRIFRTLTNCPEEDCLSSCPSNTIEIGRNCKKEETKCCQAETGGLFGNKKKKDSDTSTQTTEPAVIIKPSKINIMMNDDINPISSGGTKILEIRDIYTFKISADGMGEGNYCVIQVIDSNDNKVGAPLVEGPATEQCHISGTSFTPPVVTIKPSNFDLNGKIYTLQVEYRNSTQRLAYSEIYLQMKIKSEDLKLIS